MRKPARVYMRMNGGYRKKTNVWTVTLEGIPEKIHN